MLEKILGKKIEKKTKEKKLSPAMLSIVLYGMIGHSSTVGGCSCKKCRPDTGYADPYDVGLGY